MLAALALCLLIIGPAVALGAKKADESDVIKNDAFFYNKDSNTFIEPPYMAGKGDWFWPARLAREMVGAMTVDEKVSNLKTLGMTRRCLTRTSGSLRNRR